ncbi:hypothetical protein EW145_g659 [Phellinidium pouzarii]|uniref:Uncharacterized protein n=1 Tax=Phellinidium pouzarii TaxID=167371 RepID=A0A4S4LHI3_9AGAM|nr:hypothetical protein EW145_g659 [Phellinidium pouzarii]
MPNNSRLQAPHVASGGGYAGDLTNATTMNGGRRSVTPTRKSEQRPAINTQRKQTLLSLLDILAELQKDGDSPLSGEINAALQGGEAGRTWALILILINISGNALSESYRTAAMEAADEQLQKVGAEAFYKFQKRINNLDRELRNFANASRQLGSSVGILSSAFHLHLFPRRVQRQSAESYVDQRNRTEDFSAASGKQNARLKKPLPHVARPLLPKEIDVEEFPTQLEAFADDVVTFLKSLNEFPEFTDEAVNNSMNSFEADLKARLSFCACREKQ